VGPLWKETGDLATWDIEKAEILNDFFDSVFTASALATLSKLQTARTRIGRMKNCPL